MHSTNLALRFQSICSERQLSGHLSHQHRSASIRGKLRSSLEPGALPASKREPAPSKELCHCCERKSNVRVRSSGDDPCCPTAADALDAAVNSCPERAPHGLRNRAGVP